MSIPLPTSQTPVATARRRGVLFCLAVILLFPLHAQEPQTTTDTQTTHSPVPGLTIRERMTHYTVDATRPSDMREQMAARGPRTALGHPVTGITRSQLTARYLLWPAHGQCTIGDVQVEVDIELRLPRWTPEGTPSPEMTKRWHWLSEVLQEHEQGHRTNGLRAGEDLLQRLQVLPAESDCRRLERTALRVRREVMAELRRRDSEYDRDTDYGRKAIDERIEADRRRIREIDAERATEQARQLIRGM